MVQRMKGITFLVNDESLSTMTRLDGPEMHISLGINASARTCAILHFIGITKMKLLIPHVTIKRYVR